MSGCGEVIEALLVAVPAEAGRTTTFTNLLWFEESEPTAQLNAAPACVHPGDAHTALDPAANRARGAFDFYGHPDGRAWIWLRPYEPPAETPDREYPFQLITGSVLEHWGTGAMTQRIPVLHRSIPRAYVEIHREDAKGLGVRNGDMVRLVSRRGTLDIEARIDYRAQPPRGQLFVPSFDESRPVNLLTIVDQLIAHPRIIRTSSNPLEASATIR